MRDRTSTAGRILGVALAGTITGAALASGCGRDDREGVDELEDARDATEEELDDVR